MRKLIAVLTLAVPAVTAAKDIEFTGGSERQAKSVAGDLVAATDYRATGPAEATGIAGFGLGVVGTYVAVESKSAWKDVTGESFSNLTLLGVQATKGLPLGIDVGLFYGTITDTNADVFGGELRYAILEGSTVSPALTVRGSYSQLSGPDTFDLSTTAVDLQLSKGFALITPYVGVGYVMGEAEPDGGGGSEDIDEAKTYIGARISLGLLEFTPELGQVGDTVTYSLRGGFSFSL